MIEQSLPIHEIIQADLKLLTLEAEGYLEVPGMEKYWEGTLDAYVHIYTLISDLQYMYEGIDKQ